MHMPYLKTPLADQITHKMEINLNMFHTRVIDKIEAQLYGTKIVAQQHRRLWERETKLSD
jgi:hypothetical protein